MDLPHDTQTFHNDAQLCQYLLSGITTTHALDIRKSEISRAGSGLFTLNDIPDGEDIFRSLPLTECVADGLADSVCDLCYSNTSSKVHPSGRFRIKDDVSSDMITCSGCGKCYYCSKVSQAVSQVGSDNQANYTCWEVMSRQGVGYISQAWMRSTA